MFPAVFNLTLLDGQNGFSIPGIIASGELGYSVGGVGDINGDGLNDLILGAPYVASNQGAIYVLFGNRTLGNSRTFNLNTLNGKKGFSIPGIATGGLLGSSVSSAGDVNGDGVNDLIVGAPNVASNQGVTYVLFGNRNLGSSGTFNLNALNGQNGFSIPGIMAGGYLGTSVSTVEDVNGDGLADLIVGVPGGVAGSSVGDSYVLFGNRTLGSSGTFNLNALNGQNGFSIPGIAAGGGLGNSVSSAGDVNGDGLADLIIGAYYVGTGQGASYVLFGRNTLGSSGTFNLNTLNGQNGFSIPGIGGASGFLGYSVSSAGDVNGDGLTDLIVGAFDVASQQGASYVLFGSRTLGGFGTFNPNTLNGQNGFSIPGIAWRGQLGFSVSTAGDVNGDGLTDLIVAAPYVASNQGANYVLFGNRTLGSSGTFNLTTLNGQNGFSIPGIAAGGYLGLSVSAAGDVNGDGVNDFIVAAPCVTSNQGAVYVLFGKQTVPTQRPSFGPSPSPTATPVRPTFVPTLGSSSGPTSLPSINPTAIPSSSPTPFSQTFTPSSGPTSMPSMTPTAQPSSMPTLMPTPQPSLMPTEAPSLLPSLLPTPDPRVSPISVTHNQLTLSDGAKVVLNPANLQATSVSPNTTLTFLISNLQNGNFQLLPTNVTTLRFLQTQVQRGQVVFNHFGNHQAPTYSVIATDGSFYTPPSDALISFTNAPLIQQNSLNLTQGGVVTLTPSNLNITVTDGSSPNQVFIQILDLQHALITSTQTGLPLFNFTLAQLEGGFIRLTQDGSSIAPSYTVVVESGVSGISSAPNRVNTYFRNGLGFYAPWISQNYLTVTQGQSTTLTTQNILALQENGQAVEDSATFYMLSISEGAFSFIQNPSVQISFYTELQLRNNLIQFTQSGRRNIPGFQTVVSQNGVQSATVPAGIFFLPVNQPPQLVTPLLDQVTGVNQLFSFAIPPNTFVDLEGEAITLSVSSFNSTTPLPTWLHFNPLNNRFTGTAPNPQLLDISVTATDESGLHSATDFVLHVTPANTQPAPSGNYLTKTIIAGAVSGAMTLGFFGLRLGLHSLVSKRQQKIFENQTSEFDQEQKIFYENVIKPIATKVFEQVKTTGCLGYRNDKETKAYIAAIENLVAKLSEGGVNIRMRTLKTEQRAQLINTIVKQIQLQLPKHNPCYRLFQPAILPSQLEDRVEVIAKSVIAQVQGTPHLMTTKKSKPEKDYVEMVTLSEEKENAEEDEMEAADIGSLELSPGSWH